MSDYLHMRHGNDSQNKELLALLNRIFGFPDSNGTVFETLLPKLYNDEYHPAENNIILDVGGEMRAAVGVYYNSLTVGDEKLKIAGIGNVGTHPDYQGEGYMRFCMALTMDELKQNMTDIALLGGARQRYAHHGFEHAGPRYEFVFTHENIRRKYNCEKKSKFTAELLEKSDTKALRSIAEIHGKRTFRAERTAETMYDILRTWNSSPYAVYDGDEFKGWFVLNTDKSCVYELGYADEAYIEDIVICALEASEKKQIKVVAAPFEHALCRYLGLYSEHYYVIHAEMFNILCFENVIRAFLKFKATYTKLADGELVLLIEGCKLPEQLKITVKNNEVTVCETDEKPDLILKHLEAVRLLGNLYSEKRNELPPECASWFPLPLYVAPSDTV